jgi:hypothetical protein
MKIVDIVQRVRDIVSKIHHRTLQRLSAGRELRECAEGVHHLREINGVRGVLRCSGATGMSCAAGRHRPRRGMGVGVEQACPRIFQHRRTSRCGEIEALVAWPQHLQFGEHPESLCVPLEAVCQPETLAGHPIKDPFAEVAEWRMAKIMSGRRCLHDDMIKAAKITKSPGVRATAVTLIVWVSRLCTTPLVAIEVTTCVTSASLERAVANRIRSKSMRNADSPGAYEGCGSCCDLASRASMLGTLPRRRCGCRSLR